MLREQVAYKDFNDCCICFAGHDKPSGMLTTVASMKLSVPSTNRSGIVRTYRKVIFHRTNQFLSGHFCLFLATLIIFELIAVRFRNEFKCVFRRGHVADDVTTLNLI